MNLTCVPSPRNQNQELFLCPPFSQRFRTYLPPLSRPRPCSPPLTDDGPLPRGGWTRANAATIPTLLQRHFRFRPFEREEWRWRKRRKRRILLQFPGQPVLFFSPIVQKKEMVENWTAIFFLLLHDSYRLHYEHRASLVAENNFKEIASSFAEEGHVKVI